jgi:hypothetical protein
MPKMTLERGKPAGRARFDAAKEDEQWMRPTRFELGTVGLKDQRLGQ